MTDIRLYIPEREELTVFPADYEGARRRDKQAREEAWARQVAARIAGFSFGTLFLFSAALILAGIMWK